MRLPMVDLQLIFQLLRAVFGVVGLYLGWRLITVSSAYRS
jgi:hypothetical protein